MLKDRIALAFDYKSNVAYRRTSYGNDPPLLSKEVFQRNLETFVTLAKARRIGIILATQALEPSEEYWDRALRYKTYNDRVVYPLHEEFIAHHGVFNDIIRKVANEQSVLLVDNSALLAGDRQFFADYVYYTKKGVETLADNFFQFIVSKRLIK